MPTITDLQRKVVALAASQIGESEHPPGSNRTKYGVEYGWNGVAWCDIFESVIFTRCGIPMHSASCGAHVDALRKAGRFHDFGTVVPQVGWLAFYDWDGDGWADHVSIVERALGGPRSGHVGVEGNTADVVARRTRTQKILGYGDPYPREQPPPPPKPTPKPRIQEEDTMFEVAPGEIKALVFRPGVPVTLRIGVDQATSMRLAYGEDATVGYISRDPNNPKNESEPLAWFRQWSRKLNAGGKTPRATVGSIRNTGSAPLTIDYDYSS